MTIEEFIEEGYHKVGTFAFDCDIYAKGEKRILYDRLCNIIVTTYSMTDRKPVVENGNTQRV